MGGSGVHEGNLFVNESLVCLDNQQGLEVAQVVCRSLSPHLIWKPITYTTAFASHRMLGFSRWRVTAKKFVNLSTESEPLHVNCEGTEIDVRSTL